MATFDLIEVPDSANPRVILDAEGRIQAAQINLGPTDLFETLRVYNSDELAFRVDRGTIRPGLRLGPDGDEIRLELDGSGQVRINSGSLFLQEPNSRGEFQPVGGFMSNFFGSGPLLMVGWLGPHSVGGSVAVCSGAGTITVLLDGEGGRVTANSFEPSGRDCAEVFDLAEDVEVEPGSVMILGEGGQVAPCTEEYDTRVAGIVSGAGGTNPGILLGASAADGPGVPIALTGRVSCKVDASFGPIGVGDLLTTSSHAGHAMKATDKDRSFGAILGKSMSRLESGRGLVPVLVGLR